MTFLRTLSAELLKLRRTLAIYMVFAAPLLIVGLALLMYHERSAFYVKQGKPLWDSLLRNAYALWAVLMLPLYITLQTALLSGMEHAEDRWRSLLAMPVPRWSIYFAKLVIPCAMVWISSLILNFGCIIDGLILRRLKPALRFPDPAPWGTAWHNALITLAAALLILAVQHWVSLRFPAFAGAAGFGVAATITGSLLINSAKYGPWWPWCLPARVMSATPEVLTQTLWYSAIGAAVVSIAGAIEFTRREVRG